MKQFLVITSNSSLTVAWEAREQYVRNFCTDLEAQLPGVQVRYTTYEDISYLIQGSDVRVYDERNQIDLKDINILHFKNWASDSVHAAAIANYLKHHGVCFFNEEVNTGLAAGKLAQMCSLALHDLPVPDTYFLKKTRLKELLSNKQLPSGFEFPLIMKADEAAKGEDNYLVKNFEEAVLILSAADTEKEFVIQSFLPNDGDYRVLFIGTGERPLVFHRQGVAGNHLNNTSQGGQGTFVDPAALPKQYIKIAREAAQIMKREICGVDLLVNKHSNEVYILEVNSTPALATGFGVAEKTAKFATFLEQQLIVGEKTND